MVEVSLTIFTTTISTIIAVTMTAIFFCCWRKKGSGDIVAGKTDKSSPTKEEFRKEKSPSPIPVIEESPADAVVTEDQSSRALVDSNEEDLGDFSAVQRETEILRSYRKPPPPKNRARQSRAPRHHKGGNDSLDIFTELSEEDGKNGDSSGKENIGSYDDAGNALLRSRSQSRDKIERDARSSMLADIEQTLAALHMSDQNTSVPSGEGTLSADKARNIESISKVINDTHDEKLEMETNSEPHTNDVIMSEVKSSPLQVLISPDMSAEPISSSVAASPISNHILKLKMGPKVSPKPSPRLSARVSSGNDSLASPATENCGDHHENQSLSLSSLADNADSADTAISSLLCPSSQTETETTDVEMIEETTTPGQHTIVKSPHEISKNNLISPLISLDNTGSDVVSIPTDTLMIVREEIKSEGILDSFNDRSETAGFSDVTGTSVYPVTDIVTEGTATEFNGSITVKSTTDEDAASPVQSDSQTLASDGKEADPPCDLVKHSDIIGSLPESTAADMNMVTAEGVAGQGSPDKEIPKAQPGGIHGRRSSESGREGELNDDQTGKGKISKIPVRSGSKPRSSPP